MILTILKHKLLKSTALKPSNFYAEISTNSRSEECRYVSIQHRKHQDLKWAPKQNNTEMDV